MEYTAAMLLQTGESCGNVEIEQNLSPTGEIKATELGDDDLLALLKTAMHNMTEDRRRSTSEHSYEMGLTRVWSLILNLYDEEDRKWADHDSEHWQIDQPLKEHCILVSRVTTRMQEFRVAIDGGKGRRRVFLGQWGGLLHDAGKTVDECSSYRKRGKLTPEEKVFVDRHARLSGEVLAKILTKMRWQDLDERLINELFLIITNHHHFWRITDDRLRQLAIDLSLADSFIAGTEKRFGGGKSQFVVLAEIELEAEKGTKLPGHVLGLQRERILAQLQDSSRVLNRLYGFEFSFESPRPNA